MESICEPIATRKQCEFRVAYSVWPSAALNAVSDDGFEHSSRRGGGAGGGGAGGGEGEVEGGGGTGGGGGGAGDGRCGLEGTDTAPAGGGQGASERRRRWASVAGSATRLIEEASITSLPFPLAGEEGPGSPFAATSYKRLLSVSEPETRSIDEASTARAVGASFAVGEAIDVAPVSPKRENEKSVANGLATS